MPREKRTMESVRLECVLDSIQLFRAQVDELRQQQHRLCLESISRMVALADLPVSISSAKRRKGSTRYFQTNEQEQHGDLDDKENAPASGSVVRGGQLKSCKASVARTRKRKPLVEAQAVSQSGRLDALSACTRGGDGGESDPDVAFLHKGRGNDGLVQYRTSSVPNVLAEKSLDVKTAVQDLDPPVLTRARAKMLQKGGGNVTVARGEQPLKKRKGRKGNVKATCSPPAEKDETTGKLQNRSPREEQSIEATSAEAHPVEKENALLTEGNPRLRSSDSLAGTDENRGSISTIAIHSVAEQSLAVELETKETTVDAIGAEGADVQSLAVSDARERIDKRVDEMQLLALGKSKELSTSPRNRDCGLDEEKFQCSPEPELELLEPVDVCEGKGLLGQVTRTQLRERNSEGTPVIVGRKDGTRLVSGGNSSDVSIFPGISDNSTDEGKFRNSPGAALELPESIEVSERGLLPDKVLHKQITHPTTPHSVAVHSLAVELEKEETSADSAVIESADAKSTALSNTSERTDDRKDTIQLLSVDKSAGSSISSRNRAPGVIEWPFQCSPDTALEVLEPVEVSEGKLLRGQVPQTLITKRNSTATPVRMDRRLTELIGTPEGIDRQQLSDEETGLQLEIDEGIHLGASAGWRVEGRQNSRNISNMSDEMQITPQNSTGTPGSKDRRLTEIIGTPAAGVEELRDEETGAVFPDSLHLEVNGAIHLAWSGVEGGQNSRNVSYMSGKMQKSHRNSSGSPVTLERKLTDLIGTPEADDGEEIVDEESEAVVPDSLQLNINARSHLLETSCRQDLQGVQNCRNTSNISDQAVKRAGEPKPIIPLGLGVNSQVQQKGNKETEWSLKNSQMSFSRAIGQVEKWNRKRILEVGEKGSLVSVLSSFGKANSDPVHVLHRAYEVGTQQSLKSELAWREMFIGCAQSPVEAGKEVGLFVSMLEQASGPSNSSGPSHMERSAAVDYAASPSTKAQCGSELTLSKLMSRKQVGFSFSVASGGEDLKHESKIMKVGHLHGAREGSGAGSEIKEQGTSKLDLADSGANKPMPLSFTDESFATLQNKKATGLLLELCKKGRLTAAQEGRPSSSKLPRVSNYTVDVIDEVYRSVVVRECGNGAVSSLTLPFGNWCSEIVRNMIGAESQGVASPMDGGLPLNDRPEVRELVEDRKSDQEEEAERMKASPPVIQEEEYDTQDSVSAFPDVGFVECSQEIVDDCEPSLGSEQLLSHEEISMGPLSRVEEDPKSSSDEDSPEDDVVQVVVNSSCNAAVGSVDSHQQQVVNSNTSNAKLKQSSNLVASVKSFVPVIQLPLPSFMPDRKRVVKVKALIAAEAARRAEENETLKNRLRKTKRVEENVSRGMEKDETVDASSVPLKEFVEGSSRLDGGESSCGSQLSPRKKAVKRDRLKQATNLEIENKVKRNQAELKRIEEERKLKLLAARQNKEELVKKNRERRDALKQRKDQNRLGAEPEEKGPRQHAAAEESDREKRAALEDKIKSRQCTPRPGEKENRQGEEVRVKGAGVGGVLQACRPGQTPANKRSNMLGQGTLRLRSAVRVPVLSKDKRTPGMVPAALKRNGRHPSSSFSSSRLLSLNADSARLSSLNAEPSEGCLHNSAHNLSSLDKTEALQGLGSGDFVSSCIIATPYPEAGGRDKEEEEDAGPTSYEMSPYRESSDEEEEDEKEQPAKMPKEIPSWATKQNLTLQLLKQLTLDPDEIFSGSKTCSLKEVFGTTGSKKVQDFGKRSGSGDWFQDRLSWKEELQYKVNMGYTVPQKYPS